MQLDEVLAALLGAVVGAIVGGASTLFASLIVERQKVARESRIRMYNDLVPAVVGGYFRYTASRIQQESTPEGEEFERRLSELERASVIAGRKDLALTRDLINVLIARELAAHRATTRGNLILTSLSSRISRARERSI
jgi:hypothetical protein